MKNKEIDLIEVGINGMLFLKKNIIYLLISIIIGGILGFGKTYFQQPIYSSTMIVKSNISNETIIKLLDNINELIKQDEELIQRQHDIPGDFLRKILNVSIKENLNEKDILSVNVELSTYLKFDSLSIILNRYLYKNDYIKKEMAFLEKTNTELILKIDEKIKELDKISLDNKSNLANALIINDNQPIAIAIIELTKEKRELQKQIEFFDQPLLVIKDFNGIIKSKDYEDNIIQYSIITFCLCLVVLLLIRLNKYLNSLKK